LTNCVSIELAIKVRRIVHERRAEDGNCHVFCFFFALGD